MKLVTFQSFDAVRDLFNKGYLECDNRKINLFKAGPTYQWIVNQMNEKIEILKDDGYCYDFFNYIRSNGQRIDWIKEYYKMLK